MVQKKLIEKFGNVINHMSCVYINEGEKHLRALTEKVMPRRVALEIGTYQAVSACILSEYFQKVITLDIEEQPLAKDIINFLDVKNVSRIIVKSREDEIEIVRRAFDNVEMDEIIDMVFIDGEHFHGELAKDWDMVKDKCNNILIHDYDPYFKEVFDFVNSIEGWDKQVSSSFILLTAKQDGLSKFIPSIKSDNEEIQQPEIKEKKKRGRPARI